MAINVYANSEDRLVKAIIDKDGSQSFGAKGVSLFRILFFRNNKNSIVYKYKIGV